MMLDAFLWRVWVDDSDKCWTWEGNKAVCGHGHPFIRGRGRVYAHRVTYEMFLGPVPDGKEVHHTCENPECVNPDHLLAVTRREHRRLHNPPPTHCKAGHEMTPENTVHRTESGGVRCRTCINAGARVAHHRRKAARAWL